MASVRTNEGWERETSISGSRAAGPLDVARYIAQMVMDLETLAKEAGLDDLAYYLTLARAESDRLTGDLRAPENKSMQAGSSARSAPRSL